MSRNIWVTSDTHYNHAKILTFIDYNGMMYMEEPERMATTMFPEHKFKTTCESERLPIDEKYAE